MKRVLIFTILFALMVVLSGCSKKSNSAKDIEARKICNFKKVYDNVDVGMNATDDIYVDTTTGALYFRTWPIEGLTPLHNADGSLKIWDGYKEVK